MADEHGTTPPEPPEQIQITLKLPEEHYLFLEQLARINGISMTEAVVRIVADQHALLTAPKAGKQ